MVNGSAVQNRVTTVGFVLALNAFALGFLLQRGDDHQLFFDYLTSFAPLLMGFLLALASASLFLWAARYDSADAADSLAGAGEILLYISLSLFVSGGVAALTYEIHEMVDWLPAIQNPDVSSAIGQQSGRALVWWLALLGSATWLWLTYVSPIRVLARRVFSWRSRVALSLVFLFTLHVVFVVGARVQMVRSNVRGTELGFMQAYARQVFLPARFMKKAFET